MATAILCQKVRENICVVIEITGLSVFETVGNDKNCFMNKIPILTKFRQFFTAREILIDIANIRHVIRAVERDGPIQNKQFPAVTFKVDRSKQYPRILATTSTP